MRHLYVDHVVELACRRRVVTTLALAPDEEVFAVHFPGNPVLPASMLMESFAQAATVLLEVSSGFTRKGLPGFFQNAKFHRPVKPGPPVTIEMNVEHWSDEGALLQGLATQNGARCAVCTLGMISAPLADFYRPEHAAAYRSMYARWLAGGTLTGFEVRPEEDLRRALVG